MSALRSLARALLPASFRRRRVRWGSLRRVEPIARDFGFGRGLPVDRWYIERFLGAHAADIRGRTLEIGDDTYSARFGGDRVAEREVLHAVPGNPRATIVGDLASGAGIPSGRYDCLVLTQVLPFIYDAAAAVSSCRRALAPGGVVLATLSGISQVSRYDMDRWGDFWRFTDASARRMFAASFGDDAVEVESHGNVLAAMALLQGIAAEELLDAELAHRDRDYPVIIGVRARAGRTP